MARASFILLPYLPTREQFSFGGFKFVPLKEIGSLCTSPLFDSAKLLTSQYITTGGHQLEKMTFVYPESINFGDFINEEDKIRSGDVFKVLYFDAFCHLNQIDLFTTENFDPVYYDINTDEYVIATKAGGIHGITSYGADLRKMRYTLPSYVNSTTASGYLPSRDIAPILEKVITEEATASLKRSLLFFSEAYRNDDRITRVSRVTNMYLAFLSLMRASPESERPLWHRNMLEVSNSSLQTFLYPIIDTETGTKKKDLNLNIAQIWGEEFYKLRCKMIHGDILSNEDFLFNDISGNNLVPCSTDTPHFSMAANIYPVLFFQKYNLINPDNSNPSFDLNLQGPADRNFSGLGFGIENYSPPFYIHDNLLTKLLMGFFDSLPPEDSDRDKEINNE